MLAEDDLDGDVGAPDVAAMEQIREVFSNLDGLVDESETGLNNLINPRELHVHFDDGIGGAEWARFDVTWYRTGCYTFHHVDSKTVNFRWDRHPKDGAPGRHFHPAPNAPSKDAEASCIRVEEPKTVARAIHKLWRRAYETESLTALNDAENPP
ncbi:hypothetical protein [Halorussus pelagicus]|uniref:hypothetical protein n=1 Tax=Halorussus pelagicus TaxID=2505977 RepID=UPI000FFC5E79|nr:hypothetical protein [Halorussus pelagicus]